MKHLHQIHQALKSPRRALLNLLQEKYYIVLICESCRQHPENKELWYLIEKPKDIVGKILPLARAGLQFASAVNTISSLGRIFGLPTPVLSDSTFQEGSEFLDELENGSLSDYSELERVAEENNSQGMPSTGGISSGGMGYCIREFSAFLTKLDPNKRWGHLSPRVNERGDLCFICPTCVSNSSVVGGR